MWRGLQASCTGGCSCNPFGTRSLFTARLLFRAKLLFSDKPRCPFIICFLLKFSSCAHWDPLCPSLISPEAMPSRLVSCLVRAPSRGILLESPVGPGWAFYLQANLSITQSPAQLSRLSQALWPWPFTLRLWRASPSRHKPLQLLCTH